MSQQISLGLNQGKHTYQLCKKRICFPFELGLTPLADIFLF